MVTYHSTYLISEHLHRSLISVHFGFFTFWFCCHFLMFKDEPFSLGIQMILWSAGQSCPWQWAQARVPSAGSLEGQVHTPEATGRPTAQPGNASPPGPIGLQPCREPLPRDPRSPVPPWQREQTRFLGTRQSIKERPTVPPGPA